MELRNIAIIAHVDHGKTTLVDQLLKASSTFRSNEELSDRAMDSNDIERERGITILAKTTSIIYKDTKINILDTPGHADFGGEVERIMNMVDGCLLLVDAFEGTMPQTRFVLKKALEAHVKPIVVINKIDRVNINIEQTLDEVLTLFIELGAPDEFLEFKTVYTSALKGTSSLSPNPEDQVPGMDAVLQTIIDEIPAPSMDKESPLQLQVALLDYNDFVGRIGLERLSVDDHVFRLVEKQIAFIYPEIAGFLLEITDQHLALVAADGYDVCNPSEFLFRKTDGHLDRTFHPVPYLGYVNPEIVLYRRNSLIRKRHSNPPIDISVFKYSYAIYIDSSSNIWNFFSLIFM